MIAGPHGGGPPPPSAVTTPLGTFRASDYGAKSVQEGSFDASGGINAAIVAASLVRGGGKVSLDSGLEYDARRTVVLLANVELEIPTGTTLKAAAGLVGDLVVAQNAVGVRFSGGGTIDGNRAAGATGNAVTLTGCTEPQVEGVTIQNAYTDNLAMVNCVRPVLDVLVGAAGRHGVYHSGTTFGRGQVTARDNGQRVAGHGVVFDAASTDNSYGPLVATDTRAGGAKTQQYGVFEVPASGCDRNTYAPSALGGNAVGTQSLVGASSGPVVIAPNSITAGMLAPGSVGDVAIAAGGLHNASLATDVARASQLVNGGFEVTQRPNGNFSSSVYTSDRWLGGGTGAGGILAPATAQLGPKSVASIDLQNNIGSAGNIQVSQKIENGAVYKGQQVTFSAWAWSDAANNARIGVNDGINPTVWSAYHAGDAAGHVLSVTAILAANATQLVVICTSDLAGGAATRHTYFDNATLVPGAVAADYVPLPPADDLARCLRYYQRFSAAPSQELGAGQAYTATNAIGVLPLPAELGGNPTLTVSAAGDFAVALSNYAVAAATVLSLRTWAKNSLTVNLSVASGLVAGNAANFVSNSATGWLAAEWNP